jgi:hypothetical protein
VSAPTRPKKAAAKRPKASPASPGPLVTEEDVTAALAAVENSPIGEDGTIRPVRIGKSGRTPNQMVDLFELDGRMYQIPEKGKPAATLQFLRDLRDTSVPAAMRQDAAVENFLIRLIGHDAWQALGDSPDTTEEDIALVLLIVQKIAFGAVRRMREAQGNS